jgi:hypothetical protein
MLDRYQHHIPTLICAVAGVLILGYAFEIGRATEHQREREQLKAAYKTDVPIKDSGGAGDELQTHNPSRKSGTETRRDEAFEIALLGVPIGEGLLVIVTLMLVGVTYRLVTSGKESSERQLRAYVSAQPAGINPYRGIEQRILGHIVVVNSGQTPAKDILHIVRLFWTEKDNWEPELNESLTKTDAVLQPRAEMKIGSNPQPLSIITGREEDRSYLYVWGRIEYRDEFSNRTRFTNFCHRYNCTGGFVFRDKAIPPADGRYHEHGNSAD